MTLPRVYSLSSPLCIHVSNARNLKIHHFYELLKVVVGFHGSMTPLTGRHIWTFEMLKCESQNWDKECLSLSDVSNLLADQCEFSDFK